MYRGVFVLTCALLAWSPSDNLAHAGWFDWLLGPQPTVAYYPGAYGVPGVANTGLGPGYGYNNMPVYPPSNFTGGAYYPPAPIRRPLLQGNIQGVGIPGTQGMVVPNNSCNTCSQPAAMTVPQVSTPCNQCQPNVTVPGQVVNYAPQVNYRTSWARVPVTNFRPVTTLDPVTGVAVTAMQPCAASQYQVRRVPTGGSFLSNLFPWLHRRTVTANCMPTCAPTTVTPGCSSCSGGTVSVPASAPSDYYGQPATSGGTQIPGTSSPQPQPATGVPASRPGTAPADQRPSLDPNSVQGTQLSRPAGGYADTTSTEAGRPVDRTPFRLHHPPADANATRRSNLQPIPDPDAESERPLDRPSVPRLLNPRDRSASLPQSGWAVVRATWPMPVDTTVRPDREASYQPVEPTIEPEAVRQVPQSQPLDASGWRKAR